jgi:tetratricopeptide (TPR) repeat protein
MRLFTLLFTAVSLLAAADGSLEKARDLQDRPAIEKMVPAFQAAVAKAPTDAEAHYRLALAYSYLAEVSQELKDKGAAGSAAENGIKVIEAAIAINPSKGEYYRLLSTLDGQIIPARGALAGFTFGKRAKEALAKAKQLDPKSATVFVAEGVGNYYLPEALGGGPAIAVQDFQHALELDPKSAEAYMWMGLAYRRAHKNAEAREAFNKSLALNPRRVWTKQQLEKTPQ